MSFELLTANELFSPKPPFGGPVSSPLMFVGSATSRIIAGEDMSVQKN